MKATLNDGYYKVANSLAVALCKVSLNDREHRVVQAVMLKTFGFNKHLDWISNGQLAELTGIDVTNIGKIKNGLIKRQILVKENASIGLNLYINEWDVVGQRYRKQKSKSTSTMTENTVDNDCNKKSITTVQKVDNDCQKSRYRLESQSITTPTKENTITKDNITILDKPSEKRVVRPEALKQFYLDYPAHRRGGCDQPCWKTWKQEGLTDRDAEQALKWLTRAAAICPEWATHSQDQFIPNITKFILERRWLMPLPKPPEKQPPDLLDNDDDIEWVNDLGI